MGTEVTARPAGYRQVMSVPGWRPWALTTLLSRIPDAMAPLALVLLGHQTGSFTVGGLASGAHAITEAALAPWLGVLADRWRGHRYVRVALVVRAAVYTLLAATATVLPAAALVILAGVAGGIGAGVPGQLRALLARTMDPPLLHPAMSLDTTLLELAWTVAPVGVSVLVAVGDPRLAVATMAVLAVAAALTSLRLPAAPSDGYGADGARRSGLALGPVLLRAALPSLALALVGGFAGGVLDTAVPPVLDASGSPASLAGVLFTGYSITSVVGGLIYGLRHWPGRIHRQAAALLAALCLVLLPAALVPSLPVIAVSIVAAGLFAAPQLTARSLTLQRDLPESAWSAGFSALYAANGAGYGLAGFAVAALLPLGAHFAFAVPLAVCIAAAVVAFLPSGTARS
ncbi:MFS transporter [Streptomyces caelestis]|uniref:MFS family permease n=1 Tax=Streptomyces caelestis TaxID=36816 RepID=A0A7W9HDF1_9ACTN|nr:MFS transporter [Streptomyces caelestis]MBB5800150.1 MFS family permease [Streptomyces caelestis]